MNMIKKLIMLMVAGVLGTLPMQAQKVDPKLSYTDENGFDKEDTSIKEAQAPLPVVFRANPTDIGEWTPSFEWHVYRTKGDAKRTEVLTRYEEETEYTFMESGSYEIELKAYVYNSNGDTLRLESNPLTVDILDSKLEFPNAFSPNGDGTNDIYRAKPDYKSIVSFHAVILNRWGQKLYEWDSPAGGWDGKVNGHDAKDGVYFVMVKARGADGHEYDIRKDVNLLRGYTQNGSSTTGK